MIDLHVHLDGSLSLETVKKLAKMQNIDIPDTDAEILEKIQVSEDCKDLNEYLEKFDLVCSLLASKEAIALAVYDLCEELKSQGMIYAEIRFAPSKLVNDTMSQEDVVVAAIEGLHKTEFDANLILCCMRGDDFDTMSSTINIAHKYINKGVAGVDLAGAEALYKTSDYSKVFEKAKELEIPVTIHAGEAAGPESVYAAIDMGAKRIGHGVRALEDKELIKLLKEKDITLELCPTSNLNTNIFEELTKYPIKDFVDAGVKITVNTDNMTVSNTTRKREIEKLVKAVGLSKKEEKQLVINAINASFADDYLKKKLREKVDEKEWS